jgi:hypothetical protein
VTFNDPPTTPQSLRGDSTGPGIGLIDVGRAPERTARIQLESGETEE